MQVHSMGFTMGQDGLGGKYTLEVWVRPAGEAGPRRRAGYSELTYTELCDVMYSELDQNRPGFEYLGDGVQRPLWGDLGY